MKFQNPSFKFFLNGRTNEQRDERTNRRTSRKQYAPHFFKVGGINKLNLEPLRNASYEYQIEENLGNAISPYGP